MMNDTSSTSLCRICLNDGATIPLFDETSTQGKTAHSKLCLCLCEKVEDIEGYPRNICTLCNNTLETIVTFINKYKESRQLLQNGLAVVKQENVNCQESADEAVSEVEIEIDVIKNVKAEIDDHYDDNISDIEDTIPLKDIKIKQKSDKKCVKSTKTQKVKSKNGHNANRIAASILEGDFSWNGEKCLKIGQTTVKKTVKQEPQPKKPQPQNKIKIPGAKSFSEEPKLCDLCGETCNSSSHLSSHKLRVHNKTLNKCPKCPKICSTEYDLGRHMKRVHSDSKNYVCPTCGKAFPLQGQRTSHIKQVHNKHLNPKKMFTCKFCGKTYKCPKSVVVHERSVHTGYKPAECSICGSKFSHIDYLKEHLRLHTGERPFKCPICGKGYTQRSNMKSHLRIHKLSELDPVTMSKLKPNYLKLLKA